MTTEKHWIGNDKARAAFWAQCNGLGLSHDQVHEGLGVESVKNYGGTIAEALETLTNYAAGLAAVKEKEVNRDLALALSDAMQSAPEAAVVAWTTLERDGFKWSLTVRSVGLPPGLAELAMKQVLGQMKRIETYATANDYTGDGKRQPTQRPAQPARQAQTPSPAAPMATTAALPPPVASAPYYNTPPPLSRTVQPATPPATAAPSTQTQPPAHWPVPPPPAAPPTAPATPTQQAQDGSMELIQAEFIKTVDPTGSKVVVQFWRPNDQWARLTWYLGGEKLLEIAPDLVAAGYTAAHFDAPGGNYPVPVNIYWTPGKLNPNTQKPYKDIQRIEVR